ncbi:single-stranded DNA-binding protein [Staphylococcus aureus]|uniref:single-stranded DNA-binding protein n=1 Tax=Staphylococcus aureus TaxID=1280 RepID=UPI0018E9410E|nr:single-stranded DNA-binding protein [Staphylococcus aureus]MBJ6234587.1 single-stranded DNA-binding protein [Staphylococcus aureus]MBJ6252682.1 single-stranded DNA-binding protein [Staphylococcus aureus]MBJ6342949.1 single-stranded DNA-binding protein [Staphylococcus aureus]MBJ6359614.1 single-stranded DNA-binding protein [Staphylococcus aureus]QQF60883.1 single-stranded DNA-binding protein [Staphylococcus aureus]
MLNMVIQTGYLTTDLEAKSIATKSGEMKNVMNGTIAVNDERSQYPDYINFTAWGKWSEVLEKYTTKGSLVTLVGKWKKNKSKDKNGNTTYFDYLLVDKVTLLENKETTENKKAKNEMKNDPFANSDKESINDIDIDSFADENGVPY